MPPLKSPPRWVMYALLLGIVSLSLYTIFGERGMMHLRRLQNEKSKLDDSNYLLQRENESLRERISRLRHDDHYLEKLAREELNLVRPGEIIYRFPASDPARDSSKGLSGFPSKSRPSSERNARR